MNTRPSLTVQTLRLPLVSAVAHLVFTASTASAQTPISTVDLQEAIRVVSNDSVPGMLLTGVEDLVVLPDGRIVTLHRREPIVRVFDPTGQLIRTLGRLGDGPGEFDSPASAGYVADRIWVRDVGRGYQLFDARTYALVGAVAMGPTSGSRPGLTSDSTSFHYTEGESARVSIYDRTGARRVPIDLTLRQAGDRSEVQVQELSPRGMPTGRMVAHTVSSPLNTYTQLALVPGGSEVVVLEASELWNGSPGQLTIRRIPTATGRVSAAVTVSLPPRHVTSSEADSLIAQLPPSIRWRAAREPGLRNQYRAKAKVPSTYPAFQYFMPSADGVLWLTEHASPDTRLIVDATTGEPLMRVRLPKGMRVVAVSRTHAWGVALDANDRPIISRYRVLP